MITTILAFLIVFGVLVFVHELGHFLAARFFGVRVDEFAFGFGPKIWSKKRGKTLYSVNALPLGGFVKLYGEEGEESKGDDSLQNKKPWQKAIIFAAGVLMNFVLAYLLLTGFYLFGGKALIMGMEKHSGVTNTQRVFVTDVVKDSPAEKAGVEAGDRIVKVNGESVSFDESVISAVQNAREENGQKVVEMTFERSGKEFTNKVSTYTDKVKSGNKEVEIKRIGIGLETTGKIQAKWYLAPVAAAKELFRITKITVIGLVGFFGNAITKLRISEDVGGPVALVQLSGTAAKMGLAIFIQFLAVISVTLGVLNIFPFPALDGGHILFLAIEKVAGREIPANVKDTINKIGFALLLILIVAVTFKDLGRIGLFKFLTKD